MTNFLKPIVLNDSDRRKLGTVLFETTEDLEDEHGQYFDNLRSYHSWYNAKPLTRTRNFPFRNASNVVVPLIRTSVDATVARIFTLMQSRRTSQWTGRSENEQFAKEHLSEILRFLNWAAVNEFDSFWGPLDWLTEMAIAGCSVMVAEWEEEERNIYIAGRAQPISIKKGPKLKHWPLEHILWEPGQRVGEADIVITQSFPKGSALRHRQFLNRDQRGAYEEDWVNNVLAHPHKHGSPGAEIRDQKQADAGIDAELRASNRREYDIRTAWVEWPMLSATGIDPDHLEVELQTGEKARVPLIIEYSQDAKEVLRVTPNPYLSATGNPFFDTYFRKTTGDPRGQGLAMILENPQRAMTSMVNQSIDAVTLQNSMPFMTTDPEVLTKPITPGQGFLVNDINSVVPFNANMKAIFPDIAMVNLVQVFAERASGVNDALLGREIRSGGHPSPATNFLGMLDQAREIGSPPVRMVREQWSRIGERIAALYQQFDTDEQGRITRVFGASDAQRIQAWLFPTDQSIAGNARFDVTALSETENPQQEIQQALLTSQATQQYLGQVLQVVSLIERPDVPQLAKETALKALEVLGTTHQQFLEAADFDQAHEAIITLQDQGVDNARALSQFTQQLGALGEQANGGAGAAAVGGVPALPGPASGDAVGSSPLFS